MTTDRDRSIERLLRRALPPDPQAPDRDCPDAETLAALADDALTAAARREVEGHIADCHRCQALTAAMVRAEAPMGTPTDLAAGEVPAWRRRALNWLVPAAAAATAVALWVLIPGQRTPLPGQPTPEGQIAEAPAPQRQIAATPPPASSEVVSSEPLQIPVDARADSPARGREADVGFERAAPAAPPAAAPAEESLKVGESLSREARSDVARTETVAPQRERSLDQSALPAAAAPAAANAAGLRAAAGFDVVSPNPQIRWRVGPGPVVQYSADGGATWATQQTGTSAELTAGSSPAPEVCWLVGPRGIVLRTTDGGRQWQPTRLPETIDLTAVTASTPLNAFVSLADGRRFATTDGGRTWAPVRE